MPPFSFDHLNNLMKESIRHTESSSKKLTIPMLFIFEGVEFVEYIVNIPLMKIYWVNVNKIKNYYLTCKRISTRMLIPSLVSSFLFLFSSIQFSSTLEIIASQSLLLEKVKNMLTESYQIPWYLANRLRLRLNLVTSISRSPQLRYLKELSLTQ